MFFFFLTTAAFFGGRRDRGGLPLTIARVAILREAPQDPICEDEAGCGCALGWDWDAPIGAVRTIINGNTNFLDCFLECSCNGFLSGYTLGMKLGKRGKSFKMLVKTDPNDNINRI